MSSMSDGAVSNTFFALILGAPIMIGILILSIPFIFISVITGVSLDIVIKSILVFGAAVFFVFLFCKHQILENGILGLIVGTLIYKHFAWHPVFCILAGAGVVVLLFLIAIWDIGFWIKTVIFSIIVTFFAYGIFYSNAGLFPASDTIWKVAFAIIFFLENLYIRVCLRGE